MTPAEKAKELVEKFISGIWKSGNPNNVYDHAKQCALITVEEILNDYEVFNKKHKTYKVPSFWQDVAKEIHLL